MAPEEPTGEPAMISTGLLSKKPAPATAQPECEFCIGITAGRAD